MTIVVSACLLGENCKYNGGNNRNERVLKYVTGHRVIAVCPERAGGLPAPRDPVEWVNGSAMTAKGLDCTAEFTLGVQKTIESLAGEHIDLAILQSRSPTCGVHQIYDGTFSGGKIDGMGILAKALHDMGVPLMDAADVPEI